MNEIAKCLMIWRKEIAYGRNGKTKAYSIIKKYNGELAARGFLIIRGRCPRKYFEQKVYGYADYYNPADDLEKNQSMVAEDGNYEAKEKALTD